MKIIFTIFLTLILSISYSQEICDNGIDDDGNGLIDLQDSECHCKSVISLIPNHSFEDTNCCPPGEAQMHCAVGWQQASPSTSDYFNTCGYESHIAYCDPPIRIADGNGYVGFLDNLSKEYIGTCLSNTLYAGTKYRLIFEMNYCHGPEFNTMALFGSNNCSNLPFLTSPFSGPPPYPIWVLLDSAVVNLNINRWNEIELNFTPTFDIKTIILGPGRKKQTNTLYDWRYYFLDNLILNETSKFGPDIRTTGSFCLNDLVLMANYDSLPNSIQWYKDDIAIIGENSVKLSVPPNSPGTYQVRLNYDSDCIIKFYKTKLKTDYEIEMPNVFTPNNDNINDVFKPIKSYLISDATLTIYNRWGQIVHKKSGFPFSWDGKSKEKESFFKTSS